MVKGFHKASLSTKNNSKHSSLLAAIDCQKVSQQLAHHFEELTDPRGTKGVLHPFMSIVTIALLATLGGAKGWEDIETYGVSHQCWLSEFLALPFGIPSADTYRRLFERLSPSALERSFNRWLSTLVVDLGAQVIPIDGKTVKGSYDRNKEQSALHLVSAWASENRLFLGADYVLALKANHPSLHQEVKQWFENALSVDFEGIEYSYDVRVESGHTLYEKRQVWAVSLAQVGNLYKQSQWSGLQTIVMVIRTRHLWNKTTTEVMFYLSSLPPDAQQLGKVIRQHWSIENQLHWVLDVTFGEDASI